MTKKKLSQIPSGYSGIVVRPTPEQLKKDLNRGSGIVVAQGGGVRKPLNKYGNEVKRRVNGGIAEGPHLNRLKTVRSGGACEGVATAEVLNAAALVGAASDRIF